MYYVYILASDRGVLYTGVTNDLMGRVWAHRSGLGSLFTAKYKVGRLVFYESTVTARSAIAREKEIKGWTRKKKVALVESVNPKWEDLAEAWFAKIR